MDMRARALILDELSARLFTLEADTMFISLHPILIIYFYFSVPQLHIIMCSTFTKSTEDHIIGTLKSTEDQLSYYLIIKKLESPAPSK